jgi:hypothetical protein
MVATIKLVFLTLTLQICLIAVTAMKSNIICMGAWSNCTTIDGELSCRFRNSVSPFQSTVCHVTNACISNGELELFDDSPMSKSFHNEEIPMSPFTTSLKKNNNGNIKIQVRRPSEIPNNSSGIFRYITGVLIENVDNKNVGHVYGDELWPVFQMLHRYRFNWKKNHFQLILRKNQEKYKPKVHDLASDYKPISIQNEGYNGISNSNSNEKQKLCFNNLYVGSNSMSYSEGSPEPNALSSFRNFLLYKAKKKWNIGIGSSSSSNDDDEGYSPRSEPNILFVMKDIEHSAHPTKITNFNDAIIQLKKVYPLNNIKLLKWHGKSQKEQIDIMQNTDILYSQPGSDVMTALFLPSGSSLLTPCRALDATWVHGGGGRGNGNGKSPNPSKVLIEYGNEIRIWFNSMPNMRCVQVCGDHDILFDKSKYMIPGTIHIENLIKNIGIIIDDWKTRREARLIM